MSFDQNRQRALGDPLWVLVLETAGPWTSEVRLVAGPGLAERVEDLPEALRESAAVELVASTLRAAVPHLIGEIIEQATTGRTIEPHDCGLEDQLSATELVRLTHDGTVFGLHAGPAATGQPAAVLTGLLLESVVDMSSRSQTHASALLHSD